MGMVEFKILIKYNNNCIQFYAMIFIYLQTSVICTLIKHYVKSFEDKNIFVHFRYHECMAVKSK